MASNGNGVVLRRPTLEEIDDAARVLREADGCAPVPPTPLVRCSFVKDREVYLKLESLSPVNSFKLRGAGYAISKVGSDKICTASAGNMGQGVAYHCREMGKECFIIVPDNTPQMKIDAMELLGAKVKVVPFDEWWKVMMSHDASAHAPEHVFIHPCVDQAVLTGNATVGAEIFEQLPDVQHVFAPYGGGSLSTGIASVLAVKAPEAKVHAVEPASAAAFAHSLKQGEPSVLPEGSYAKSFVDGCGAKSTLAGMWPVSSQLLDAVPASLESIADAVKQLFTRQKLVVEGAGACSLAAALANPQYKGKIVCVISGGCIDTSVLMDVVNGKF